MDNTWRTTQTYPVKNVLSYIFAYIHSKVQECDLPTTYSSLLFALPILYMGDFEMIACKDLLEHKQHDCLINDDSWRAFDIPPRSSLPHACHTSYVLRYADFRQERICSYTNPRKECLGKTTLLIKIF